MLEILYEVDYRITCRDQNLKCRIKQKLASSVHRRDREGQRKI